MTLEGLQQLLKKYKYDAFLVTHDNLFLGQDIRDDENKIYELCGFSGSAGTLIVFQDHAVLLVDGRYEIQAALEVKSDKTEVHVAGLQKWLQEQNFTGKQIKFAYNPWCHAIQEIERLQNLFPQISFIPAPDSLTESLQSSVEAAAFEHDIEFAGLSRDEKLAQTSRFLQAHKLEGYLFTAADDVSWLLNLRSDALPHTPILRAYALLYADSRIEVFADNLDLLNLHPLKELGKYLKPFRKGSLGLDKHKTPQQILNLLGDENSFRSYPSPVAELKAVKNPVELAGIADAHRRDGEALVNFLFWLENNYRRISELDVVEKLHDFRRQQPLFYSESFATIAASGPHGAIVHYQPDLATNRPLDNNSVLLLDSGAQYFDGTTDVTRTIALGQPSPAMIRDFTLVLKAHITLSSTLFPAGTSGAALDAVTRRPLWQEGKNYNHGTGHGVGCFLNVHENPPSVSPRGYDELKPGMITSVEPGCYIENSYGIRIENLAVVEKMPGDGLPLYGFRPLTLVPLDKRLIDKYLLSAEELLWLNNYHQTVWEQLSSRLAPDEKAWLQQACAPL